MVDLEYFHREIHKRNNSAIKIDQSRKLIVRRRFECIGKMDSNQLVDAVAEFQRTTRILTATC